MSCCPGLAKCRNRWPKAIIQTPLPGMGGAFCLPISMENPAIATAPDVPDCALTPRALSQDNLATGVRRTTSPNGDIGTLGAVVLFQSDPAAQGTEGRSGIAPGHATLGDVQTDNSKGIGLGTQLVPTEDADIDAPLHLTQIKREDGGNGGGGGDPGAVTQGEKGQEEGGMVRVRDIEGEEDLACQVLHPCDNQLIAVFGDSIHCNDGNHLDGGIADNGVWQGRYDRVVSHPHPMYNPPKGGIGQRVIAKLAREFRGMREQKWNSERTLIFAACVLRKSPGIIHARDIKRRVERRLTLWVGGQYNALVQDIIGEAMRGVGSGQDMADKERVAQKYNHMVLDGKLHTAVCFATACNGSGVLLPQNACTKTGQPVMEVLQSKHSDTRIPNRGDPDCIAFEHYNKVPMALPMDCTSKDLEALALRMNGSAGLSSFDTVMLRNCLLWYGRASSKLRQEMANWVEWLSNESPLGRPTVHSCAEDLLRWTSSPGSGRGNR